ncbi:hypothetical protein Mucpa_5697 [Mucilaginibacter paludis DSM 18603]|uniref:Uncharacterized protein n=1 Tax=Mucilaginibacter paludis DSM 18603 TaxID=714943 RepID=H1Y3J8_9SPHI|nr:hypothetical protein Mucpa_5697 [Mucilaginibacter paludis DSM 18603]
MAEGYAALIAGDMSNAETSIFVLHNCREAMGCFLYLPVPAIAKWLSGDCLRLRIAHRIVRGVGGADPVLFMRS